MGPMAQPPVLALKDVRLADGPVMLFDGVDLALEPRVRACLVGRNGAGKSTLLRILAGRVEPDAGDRFANPGVRVALVPQEPEITGATLLDYATAGGAAPHRAQAALATFGADPSRSTQGLSGGEARRAALARAFAEEPDVLLLDEPTNHLDIFAIETLEAELKASRAAALLVSHDRAFLERTTGRSFWLEGRRVRRLDKGFKHFEAWADAIVEGEAETARRADKALGREEHWLRRGVTARRARNEGRRRRLLEMREAKSARMRESRRGPSLTVDSGGQSGRLVAEADGVTKRYGGRAIFSDFSTRILRGERVGGVGPNGAGKTTLVKLLLGEIAPDAGVVKLGTGLQTAYVDQARAGLKPEMTLWDALTPGGGDSIMVRDRPKHAAAYAKEFMFGEKQLRQPVSSLSGGERNRLLLALALAKPANLLVLDEPTNDLDMDTLDHLEEILADYDGTLLLVSHDRDFIDRLATSTIALDGRGRVVETPGGWADFQSQNPGFFDPSGSRADPRPGVGAPVPPDKSLASDGPVLRTDPRGEGGKRKLSYKDARRLEELEALMPRLADQIAAAERVLADPELYARDPGRFDATMRALDGARVQLAAAEEEWLALETRREALETAR
ncbi:MAG: ABC-F family ATP-binding cassette domain-containing protein [Pseudomonadota bacterium]|nr:ABC-F family ATP-binding cassette domain-containing protein [Pseudomonadota bacterium]